LTRKLAAIVVADMVGYSRRMEADEAGTLAQLTAIRRELVNPKVEQYRGRIVKTTGDGWLAEFARVTDVRCTVDVQEAMAQRNASVPESERVQLRAGINLGEIIIEGDDIYGTGVNATARLEPLAEPGGICLSNSVYDQIESILSLGYEDMGEQTVKNISKPVRCLAVRLEQTDRHLNRNGAFVSILAGWANNFAGDLDEALASFQRARRLSPSDPGAHLLSGCHAEAAEAAARSAAAYDDWDTTHWVLAGANGHLGQIDKARAAVQKLLLLSPGTTVSRLRALLPFPDERWLEIALDGLRKAGLPESWSGSHGSSPSIASSGESS
jgi:class 3 adenylate cyclase